MQIYKTVKKIFEEDQLDRRIIRKQTLASKKTSLIEKLKKHDYQRLSFIKKILQNYPHLSKKIL